MEINISRTFRLSFKINNRVNLDIHQGTGQIPIKLLEKEKDFLKPLPSKQIRNLYKIKANTSKSKQILYDNIQEESILSPN